MKSQINHYGECDRYELNQKQLFQNNDQLISSIFPNLQLTAQQIFSAGQSVAK